MSSNSPANHRGNAESKKERERGSYKILPAGIFCKKLGLLNQNDMKRSASNYNLTALAGSARWSRFPTQSVSRTKPCVYDVTCHFHAPLVFCGCGSAHATHTHTQSHAHTNRHTHNTHITYAYALQKKTRHRPSIGRLSLTEKAFHIPVHSPVTIRPALMP